MQTERRAGAAAALSTALPIKATSPGGTDGENILHTLTGGTATPLKVKVKKR